MDEETHIKTIDISFYNQDNSYFKKEFIEQWLVSMAADLNRGSKEQCSKDYDSILGTLETDSPSNSSLDFWNTDDKDSKKNKNTKFKLKNGFRGILKKKNDASYIEAISSSLSIPPVVRDNIASFHKIKQEAKRQMNLMVNGDSSRTKNQLNTLGSKSKVKTTRQCLGTIKALELFNRGFSEIMPCKINYLDQEKVISKPETNKIKMEEVNKKIINETTKIESEIPFSDHLMQGDGWNNKLESPLSKLVKPYQEVAEKKNIIDKPSLVCHADSYVNKLERIQKYFESRSSKGEPKPEPKPGINKPTKSRIPCSRIANNAAFHSLTKELNDVPYLREHERLQWQGRNRELWYRINALYSKYNKYNDPVSQDGSEPTYNKVLTPILKPNNKIKMKQSESHLRNKHKTEKNIRINKCLPFGKTDLVRHGALEEMFVSEHTEKSNLNKEHIKNNSTDYTTWHGALEQIRDLMKKNSENPSRVRFVRKDQRCMSKISLTYSSSDWEDVSNHSESTMTLSKNSVFRAKPLFYTSNFKPQNQRFH